MFVTFIVTDPLQLIQLEKQSDHDFDFVTLGNKITTKVVIHEGSPLHPVGHDYYDVDNRLYDLRFRVHGEYVCLILEQVDTISEGFVSIAREQVVNAGCPDQIMIGVLRFVKRKIWQNTDCLISKF